MKHMQIQLSALVGALFWALAAPAGAQVVGPGKTGTLTEQRLAKLIRSMHQDDPFEQVMAVVELEKAADKATPEELTLLRKHAVPALKAGIHRETRGKLGRPKVALQMQRVMEKILNAGIEPDPPTDLATRSAKLADAIAQLASADELAKRRALSLIRSYKALGAPAMPAVKHLVAYSQDKITLGAAKTTEKILTNELWFDLDSATPKAAKPQAKVDAQNVETQQRALVEKLIKRLDSPPDSLRMRALRQLAGMKASAGTAIDRLNKMALDAKEPKMIRKTAGLTIRAITTAQVEAEEWHKWQEKKAVEADKAKQLKR